jgi:hypothetical protein
MIIFSTTWTTEPCLATVCSGNTNYSKIRPEIRDQMINGPFFNLNILEKTDPVATG